MASQLASKYLHLSDDCQDLGKPSPLAMLAATCKKIGVESPRVTRRRVVRRSSPQTAISRTPSPQPTATSLVESPVPTMSGHQLPPTPPPSPPCAVPPSSTSGFMTVTPLTVDFLSPPYYNGTLQYHQPWQSVTPRYTPYTMVVPTRGQCVPAVNHTDSYCYSPCYLPRRLSYNPYHPHSVASQISSSPVFGVYPHHGSTSSSSSSSMKVRSRREHRRHQGKIMKLSGHESSDQEVEEGIIDVVSL